MVVQTRGLRAPRDMMEVVLYTNSHRVEGRIHYSPGARLTDFMNFRLEAQFMAITHATIYTLTGEDPLYTVDFLDINRNHITMVFPKPR